MAIAEKELELCAEGWHSWEYESHIPEEQTSSRECKVCGLKEVRDPEGKFSAQ